LAEDRAVAQDCLCKDCLAEMREGAADAQAIFDKIQTILARIAA